LYHLHLHLLIFVQGLLQSLAEEVIPWAQGSVERANTEIKEMKISWMNDNDTTQWSEGLRFAQFQKNLGHRKRRQTNVWVSSKQSFIWRLIYDSVMGSVFLKLRKS
jgi:hypothetical protein